jgi:hypothetical protein
MGTAPHKLTFQRSLRAGQHDLIFEALAEAGADMNLEYPEEDFDPVYKDGTPCRTTLAINIVRRLARSTDEPA